MTHIRMPLFTFLSGFVYAYRPVLVAHQFEFALKKLRRLILPLLTAATIIFLGHMLAHDTEPLVRFSDIWRIYLFPYEHFWFLQALLIVFMLTITLERYAALATPLRFLLVLVTALLFFCILTLQAENYFSIYQSTYLGPV